MVTKSILKMALAAEKGVNFKKLKERRKHKEAARSKRVAAAQAHRISRDSGAKVVADSKPEDDEDDETEEAWEGQNEEVDIEAVDDSDTSESSVEMEEKIPRPPKDQRSIQAAPADEDDEAGEEDEEDIPLSDLEDLADSDKEDLVPHTRLTINNTTALLASLKRIAIPTDASVSFATHQTVLSTAPTAESIQDIFDDLQRETVLLGQSLEAARRARALLRAENVPFSRPGDYFAEMVKDDGHMEKVKAKLVEEATAKKASAEARKLRELKKFGKQVQVAKLQERQKAKKDTLEKIKVLKRKRQESSGDLGANEADLFDVAVDDEIKSYKRQRSSGDRANRDSSHVPNAKRQKKNEKYGFGGKKRHAKSGDAVSSGDMSGFNIRRMRAGVRGKARVSKAPRLGKSRRKAQASRS